MAAVFRRVPFFFAAFLLLAVAIGTNAQQPSGSSAGALQLTLKEAVRLALKQNPQRIISQVLVSESDRNSQIARSALLPQAGVDAHGAISQYNLQSVESISPRKAAGPYQFIEAGPSFSQTILSLPQIRGYQIGQEARREARADDQTTRENVVAAVVPTIRQKIFKQTGSA
jgi:outer membrane protein